MRSGGRWEGVEKEGHDAKRERGSVGKRETVKGGVPEKVQSWG